MLVTLATYQTITGDETSDEGAVSAAVERAVAKLEQRLDRKLESTERLERMHPTRDGSLWPHAIPISVAAGYVIDGVRLRGTFVPPVFDIVGAGTAPGIDVTYTGGWTERSADPTATTALPACIEEDLAIAAFILLHPVPLAAQLAVPAGATSVRLGDAAVTYGPNGAPAARPTRIVWSSSTMAYRYVRIGSDAC